MQTRLIEAFAPLSALSSEQTARFIRYYELLVSWNERVNLTRITDAGDVALKHFADSFTLSKYIPDGASLVDVGSGAGFPGVPLKIMRPDIRLTLIDSLGKRVDFLRALLDELGLEADAVHQRAEDAAKTRRAAFDAATARAVAPLNILCELALPLVKPGGVFLAMKGEKANEEAQEAARAIKTLGGTLRGIYDAPLEGLKHSILVIDKTGPTPDRYPRPYGKMSRNPL